MGTLYEQIHTRRLLSIQQRVCQFVEDVGLENKGKFYGKNISYLTGVYPFIMSHRPEDLDEIE